jgi:hypothetical protein
MVVSVNVLVAIINKRLNLGVALHTMQQFFAGHSFRDNANASLSLR